MAELSRRTTVYRTLTAMMFDRALARIGLGSNAAIAALCAELDRDSISRTTLVSWRHGTQAVPGDVLLAAMKLAGTWGTQLILEILATNPELKDGLPKPDQSDERVRVGRALADALWPPAPDNTSG